MVQMILVENLDDPRPTADPAPPDRGLFRVAVAAEADAPDARERAGSPASGAADIPARCEMLRKIRGRGLLDHPSDAGPERQRHDGTRDHRGDEHEDEQSP